MYRNHEPEISLFPDASWALLFSQNRKYEIALLTDGFLQTQKNKTKRLGIQNRMFPIIYTDEIGREHWKPSPTGFLSIMNQLNRTGTECIYVGDNPSKDFIAPRQLGWQTAQIVRDTGHYKDIKPDPENQAHFQIRSLIELVQIL